MKPANHASWLVPVLPAAGEMKPMLRTPAPVPSPCSTASIMLVVRIGHARIEHLLRGGRVVVDDVAGGRAHAGQHPGIDVQAAVGEDGIGAGHLERRGVVGADGHRGRVRARS